MGNRRPFCAGFVAGAVADGLDAGSKELTDFRGKVVFLNFWATWCGDCAQELGSIHSLETKLRDAPVEFVLVSDEDPAKIRGFLERLPFSMSP
jgi:cytochrome c biogenesis protein CcmG, thiol:disulfide interchange protein DsbE